MPIVNAFGFTAVIVAEPPKATVDPLNVTELFVSEAFAIFVKVFVDPLIDLFVSVSVVARPTNVSVDVGNVSVPVFEIVEITGDVNVLLVRV